MKAASRFSLLASSLTFVGALAACNDDPAVVDRPSSTSLGESAPNGDNANPDVTPSNNNGNASFGREPLPNRTPVRAAQQVTSARQVIGAGPFMGEQPSVRANDRHATPVTGKDCMTCHGGSGAAPHFAFGGTIALGKQWTTGTPTWPTGAASGNNYDSYDGYGSYDGSGGGGGGGGGNGGGYGSYNNDSYDDGAYCGGDDGGYGDGYNEYGGGGGGGGGGYNDYGDEGYDTGGGGGGSCGARGWPADRSTPSPYTGVRLVGSDGYIFDTVTDTDGNFWFKAKEDVKVPAFTGIRYGTFTVTGDTNGVACSSCHESGKADSPGRMWTWDGPTPRR